MVDPKAIARKWRRCQDDDFCAEDTWMWWNRFRSYADFNIKIKV